MLQVAFTGRSSDGDGREGAIATFVTEGDFGVPLAVAVAVSAVASAAAFALAWLGFGDGTTESGATCHRYRRGEDSTQQLAPRAISLQVSDPEIEFFRIHAHAFLLRVINNASLVQSQATSWEMAR